MISKSCKYGIRATVFLASRYGKEKYSVKDISQEIDAPEPFTAKVLQILSKHRIITSLKGPYGGFFLEEEQLEAPIINIVHAIDGLSIFTDCGMGLKNCSEVKPCPLHDQFKAIRNGFSDLFKNTKVKDLSDKLHLGATRIKNIV